MAARTAAEARAEAARLTAASEVAEARVRYEQARRAVALYQDGIRPLARRNLDTVRETYQLGRATVFDVLAEQRRYLETERAYTDALPDAYASRVSLGRARETFDERHSAFLADGSRRCLGSGACRRWGCLSLAAAAGRIRRENCESRRSDATVTGEPLPDVVITLSDEAIARAGVVVTPVTVSETAGSIRLAGVVEPNAYRQVVVAPLVSGRVTRVPVMLGDRVARKAPLVEIYSPDLADAQTRYLSMRAEFQAVEQEIARDRAPGGDRCGQQAGTGADPCRACAASHRGRERANTSAAARHDATEDRGDDFHRPGGRDSDHPCADRRSVTARTVNPGTSVDSATPLVTVVDLSTVWIVGDLYERDFSWVSVGTPAVVTTTAFPDARITGKVAYIDPQVRSETRTARIRVEVPNPGQRLRLGMYAEVQVETPGGEVQSILVPRSAVQNVADRTVVYLSDPQAPARFIEREVRLGESSGDQVVVVSGLQPGDGVVTAGSFSLRAERDRLGLRVGP